MMKSADQGMRCNASDPANRARVRHEWVVRKQAGNTGPALQATHAEGGDGLLGVRPESSALYRDDGLPARAN
jgi:hypothetical protein